MADEIVSINNLKENLLEFEMTITGLTEENLDAKFIIHSADMDLAFACKKGDNGKWSVTLPPLPMLERTAYPFRLQVIAEGYQFNPLKGSVNIVGSPEVYATVKPTKLESPTKVETPKVKTEAVVVPKSEPTNPRSKPVEQVARELMEAQKTKPAPTIEVKKTKSVAKPADPAPVVTETLLPKIKIEVKKTAEKDAATRQVLESLGLQTKKPKRKRFSLKD